MAQKSTMHQSRFNRVIYHVDMDSFYASCELAQRPDLKDVPFIVGADPKQGKGRGVVVACNYASRKFGVHSGMPISRAWELCPQASYVRPNFELYEEVSQRVMKTIQQFADKLEQVSIDEAYLDVTNRINMMIEDLPENSEEEAISNLAASIKKSIIGPEKITCSIGVSNSKIVSKIASDMQKPNGLTIVKPEKVREFLEPLPVSKIPGVGRVSQRILEDTFNAKTISDIRKIPIEKLEEKFGKMSLWLLKAANGIDQSEVVEHWEPVSQSGEITFAEDEPDYSKIKNVMYQVAQDVQSRAIDHGYVFRNVGIKIRFTGFETHTRSKSLLSYTDSLEVLTRECEKLLSEFYGSGRAVRLIGVRVSALKKRAEDQLTLLDWSG